MSNIAILGAGVMGAALAVPPSTQSKNNVTLIGSPLDDHIIDRLRSDQYHLTLNTRLPESITALTQDDATVAAILSDADIIVIGVSNAGISWVTQYLTSHNITPAALALVTKGLVQHPEDEHKAPMTYADALNANLTEPAGRIIGIGGPCIARELALGYPTRVTFASSDISLAQSVKAHFQTDFYRITTHQDIVALEACAALKNFLCIGVSAMFSAYPLEESHAKNPLAGLFNQAVKELLILSQWIATESAHPVDASGEADKHPIAFDLAGMGDLHVTVGGGRNSRLGKYLGQGERLSQIISQPMAGVTVEGMDTGKNLSKGLLHAYDTGKLNKEQLPLTNAILASIMDDAIFAFDFTDLPD